VFLDGFKTRNKLPHRPKRKIGFTTIGHREQGGKYIRGEKEKGTRGDKNTDKLQDKRTVSTVEVSVLIYRIKYSLLRSGDAVAQLV